MPVRRFVRVRFPGDGLLWAGLTEAVPGVRVDAAIESARPAPDGGTYAVLALVRGLPPGRLVEALADLGARYGAPAEVLRHDAGQGALVRYAFAVRDLASPVLQRLVRFQAAFGFPWTRFEAGTAWLLAEARGWDDGGPATRRMRQELAAQGVPAEVEVVELPPAELEAWERLKALVEAADV